MRREYKIAQIAVLLIFILKPAFAGVAEPKGQFALFKDAEFHLKGDYLSYFKHFSDRDLNGYNGNSTIEDPVTGETYRTQTDQIERWWEHELRLYPKFYFNDKLEFNMRLDMGGYIFQSDLANTIDTGPDKDDEDVTTVYADWEKVYVMEANLQMITPIGLFLIGRFEAERHGVVYALQLPQLPKWSFVAAWLIKHEGKYARENTNRDYSYLDTYNFDYLDRDDQNEAAIVTIYEDMTTDGQGVRSQQWIECRLSGNNADLAKNTEVYLPQWEFEYFNNNFHFWSYMGVGFGTIAELTKMSAADDLRDLNELGKLIEQGLQEDTYTFPVMEPEDITVENSINVGFQVDYRMGRFKPHGMFWYLDGADNWHEVSGLIWDEYEPHGYRTPRRMRLLLFGEIEDKYYPLAATLGTQSSFDTGDIAYSNVTGIQAGGTYYFNSKWDLFCNMSYLRRTNIKYFEQDYWDMFPIMYALRNSTEDETTGNTLVPLVFKNNDTEYYKEIDPFLGVELNGSLTYHMFAGLDVSLLGSYFFAGDFYEDILTPQNYTVQWADQDQEVSVESPFEIYGPYRGAEAFELADAWTVQVKVAFKFDI